MINSSSKHIKLTLLLILLSLNLSFAMTEIINHDSFSLILIQLNRLDHESCRLVCWDLRAKVDYFLCHKAKKKKMKQISNRIEENNFARLVSIDRGYEEYHAGNLYEAFVFFSNASSCKQGNAHATYIVGHMFLRGEGVSRSIREGLYQLNNAAESGFTSAIYDIGFYYYTGELEDGTKIIDIDYEKAFRFFEQAHKLNHTQATYHLSRMYYYGHYVKEDRNQALALIKQAADAGCSIAKNTISKFFLNN